MMMAGTILFNAICLDYDLLLNHFRIIMNTLYSMKFSDKFDVKTYVKV